MKLLGIRRDFEYARMRDDESLSVYLTRLFGFINQMKMYSEEWAINELWKNCWLVSLSRIYDNFVPVIERTKKLDKNDSTEAVATFEVFEQRLIFYFF